jgi:hypothetical protein
MFGIKDNSLYEKPTCIHHTISYATHITNRNHKPFSLIILYREVKSQKLEPL